MTFDVSGTRGGYIRSLAIGALVALTLVRLAVAAAMPLSPDEAYYWVWSRALAPGYLDHPPMVALWIRAGTAMLGETALGVRLLAPLSAALGTVLLADAGRVLFGQAAGLRAAALMSATLMLGAGAVTMTPDTPLIFFWTAAAWALARVAAGGSGAWWLAVGAMAGLGLDSKYTAALLGVGIALWLLTPAMRRELRTPWPWAGGLLAGALFLPPVLWNAAHGWASFAKQGGRAGDWDPSRAMRFLAELLGGQLGLATPLVFAAFVLGTVAAARRWRDPAHGLVATLVLPGLAVFVQHALGDRVQANWVAVLYPGAALAAGAWGRWWKPAAALGFGMTALVYTQATLAPLPLPRGMDPTLRLAGWDALARDASALAAQTGAAFLASEEYGAASLLAWHAGIPVLGAEPRWALFDLPPAAETRPGLLLISARRWEPPDPALWLSSEPAGMLSRARAGLEAEAYRLYRVVPRPGRPSGGAPAVSLPRRTRDAAPDPR